LREKVSVIGLGYVGLSLATFLATKRISVTGVDLNEGKIKMIKRGKPPFFEPNLELYLKKSLKNGLKLQNSIDENVVRSKFIFITVGTPTDSHEKIVLDYLFSAIESIAKLLSNSKNLPIIIIKSTVIPGTAKKIIQKMKKYRLIESKDFHLISNPEFLREGSAMRDTIHPHLIVIGGSNKKSLNSLEKFYKKIHPSQSRFLLTNNSTAELIKYANNAFLATKISFINSIANLCQKIAGVDVDAIASAIGMDPRIGNQFLNAGPGYGGSCFPKDLQALISFSKEIGSDPILFSAVKNTNEHQIEVILETIQKKIPSLVSKKISILGLAFKENTDDIRESVSIKLIKRLLKEGCKISVHDPMAIENTRKIFKEKISYQTDISKAFEGMDCVIILTPWKEYQKISKNQFRKMKSPLVIDTRRILKMNYKDIDYVGLGIGK